ncbi:MAG: peptide MFS transporter [Chitinophagales bacterium]|nr:peptide MFS transporter [Chitinophagales bacterium]MDW8428610.1 peptide MFS transporter [Chitinophagales bacterium]
MSAHATNSSHPKALYVLFFTEMWERFAYYLMVGIFFLYLIDPTATGGKGFLNSDAADLVGSFIALVYLAPFIGGMIADRYLGYRRAIVLGGLLMAAGYIGLSFPGDAALYLSLLSIIIGNGFFKPNISTLLGNIYDAEELKAKKDSAYGIFYMGINIGAFFCNFAAAYLRINYGWGYAFAAAGIGLLIGLAWLIINYGDEHFVRADKVKALEPGDPSMGQILRTLFLPAAITGVVGYFISHPNLLGTTIFGSRSNDAFFFACVPIIGFYLRLLWRSSAEDRRGLGALMAFFGVSIVFWVIYNQNSTALTIWADQYTRRTVPPAVEKFFSSIDMVQVVKTDSQVTYKTDQYLRVITDEQGKPIEEIGAHMYFKNLPKEEWPQNGNSLKLINPELFQSVNPFFIVFFTPLVSVWLFGWLRRRGREPSTPMKVTLGMLIGGLSSLVMIFAIMSTNIYENKVSMIWLISTYAVFTLGELLLSPIGLSMVSKLSPRRITAFMMGGWFLVNSIAGKISGLMATFWDSFTDKKDYFLILLVAALISAAVMMTMVKWIRQVVREKTGSD